MGVKGRSPFLPLSPLSPLSPINPITMINRKPEGYRTLLAYKKAAAMQRATEVLTQNFPKTKTMVALADQMDRSTRSVTKNITEGWKRNTTKEYFTFLGFSIGSNAELMEDAADIVTGVYEELQGVMGTSGFLSRGQLDYIPFYPLPPFLPLPVQLFLQCKEVNFLLYKLQKSLDIKMDSEGTKSASQRLQEQQAEEEYNDREFKKFMEGQGFMYLENGQVVKRQKGV